VIGSYTAPRAALILTLSALTPFIAWAQPADPAAPPGDKPTDAAGETPGDGEPGAKPGDPPGEGGGGAAGQTPGDGEPGPKPGDPPGEGGGDAVDPGDKPPVVDQTAAATADGDDDWGLEESYPPPMVIPEFGKPQPEGIWRERHHDHRWIYHNLTAVRVNPLGLTNRFRTGYRMQLSHRPEPAFMDSYASLQLDTEITPAYGVVGGRLEVQPIALFNFWGSYGFVGSFGSFGNTHSLPSAQDRYDDDTLDATKDQDYSATGHKAIISGMFQFGMAGLAIRNNVKGHWMSMDLKDNDKVFWDATLDVMIPDAGWVITNDADLLVLTDFDLKLGIRHTLTHALYRSEHRADQPNISTPHHRIGPAVIYTFFEDGIGSMWDKPTVVLLAQWWAKHRYRTSQSPGLPYLVVAFVQQGDFFTSDER